MLFSCILLLLFYRLVFVLVLLLFSVSLCSSAHVCRHFVSFMRSCSLVPLLVCVFILVDTSFGLCLHFR
jgi:hypothetical protein